MRLRRPIATALAVVALVAAGCSDDGGDEPDRAGPTTSATASSTTVAPSTSSTAAPPTTEAPAVDGCPPGGEEPPPDATADEVDDVDGDGRPDQLWISAADPTAVAVGVSTASGHHAQVPFESASPVQRAALAADVDADGRTELLLDDGRSVQLFAFDDCTIVPVTNAEGDVYTFSRGFTEHGTGVGCVEVEGQRHLVGLNVVEQTDTAVEWSRTVVEIDGTTARNGETTTGTFTSPEDDAAIELLHEVTCGDLTMFDDGVRAPS